MTAQCNIARNSTKQSIKRKISKSPNADLRLSKAKRPTRSKKPVASGKAGAIIKLLSKPKGASLAELCAATGWQPHSVRGALSGTIKKKLGLPILSEKTDKGRIYRIAE